MSESLDLKEKLQSVGNAFPDREALSKNNKLVNSYTRMPSYEVLNTLFGFVATVMSHSIYQIDEVLTIRHGMMDLPI